MPLAAKPPATRIRDFKALPPGGIFDAAPVSTDTGFVLWGAVFAQFQQGSPTSAFELLVEYSPEGQESDVPLWYPLTIPILPPTVLPFGFVTAVDAWVPRFPARTGNFTFLFPLPGKRVRVSGAEYGDPVHPGSLGLLLQVGNLSL